MPKNKVLVLFIFLFSLNLTNTYFKLRNTTESRKELHVPIKSLMGVQSIRLKNETLTLQRDDEVLIRLRHSRSLKFTSDIILSSESLAHVFFHFNPQTLSGYAFRISTLEHIPSAFLKYANGHVVFTKEVPSFRNRLFAKGKWINIQIESHNHKHIFKIQGKPVLRVQDNQYSSGILSFSSEINSVAMDNLSIQSEEAVYHDDFSVMSPMNRHYSIILHIKFFLLIMLAGFILSSALRKITQASQTEKSLYINHIKVAMIFLIPGMFFKVYDVISFAGTFTTIFLFAFRTFGFFSRTNTFFLQNIRLDDTYKDSSSLSPRNIIILTTVFICFMFTLHILLMLQSRLPEPVEKSQKQLVLTRTEMDFIRNPFFLDDALNIRNPLICFDIYGTPGLAALIVFNKLYNDEREDGDKHKVPFLSHYAALLSFHKTLPSLLMGGQKILEAASRTPYKLHQWNHVDVAVSGKKIVFFVNGEKILSYSERNLFSGGIKVLPVYRVPKIRNFKVYRLKTDGNPSFFNLMDILFFTLRIGIFILAFNCLGYFILYAKSAKITLSFFLRRVLVLFFTPLCLLSAFGILHHSNTKHIAGVAPPVLILGAVAAMFSFFLLHFFFCVRQRILSQNATKLKLVILMLFFLEGFCVSISPNLSTLNKPFYMFVHDKRHYWYFDYNVRVPNSFFLLNKVRFETRSYEKGPKKRVALFGSSSAYGDYFPAPSSEIFSAQLEQKLFKNGYKYDVLNFGIPGSTSFIGVVFLKGIYSLFKPDIVLWNYGINDSKFMQGNFHLYTYFQNMYTRREMFVQRALRKSYTFNLASGLLNSRWFQSLKYSRRKDEKKRIYSQNLHVLREFCKEKNITLVLLNDTKDDTLWISEGNKRNSFSDAPDEWASSEMFSFSKKYNVPYLYTVPGLRKRRADKLYMDNVHYSKAGHDVMASLIYHFLIEQRIVTRF